MTKGTQHLNITAEEAGVLELALQEFIEKHEAIALNLIENTHCKQAGFNHLDMVTVGVDIRDKINVVFPITEDD